MKKMHMMFILIILSTLLLGVLSVVDFAALHDIRKDYVSQEVFKTLGIDLPEGLPSWTDTALEWAAVEASCAIRLVMILLNVVFLLILRKEVRQNE